MYYSSATYDFFSTRGQKMDLFALNREQSSQVKKNHLQDGKNTYFTRVTVVLLSISFFSMYKNILTLCFVAENDPK